jgi:hypothetical protein
MVTEIASTAITSADIHICSRPIFSLTGKIERSPPMDQLLPDDPHGWFDLVRTLFRLILWGRRLISYLRTSRSINGGDSQEGRYHEPKRPAEDNDVK